MKRYKVEMQREGSVKYFFIRDMETLEIVLLPSKYLMHQVRANRSPNTIRRNAFALAYYWEYLLEEEHEAEDVYGMDCNGVQREHNKKLNNGLPILHKVPPKRDYGRYFCIMAEKGGTSHGGLTEKLSPFFHAKKQEVNAYGR